MKTFKSILSLIMSKEFRNKDLTYCDLSNLDLAKIPSSTWDGFKFFHTNLNNTNIIFDPEKLAKDENGNSILEYTSFRGCDLSYIKTLTHTSINGSDFYGTGLNLKLDVHNIAYIIPMDDTVFSKEMEEEVLKKTTCGILTIKTVKNNPHIQFSSADIFNILKNELNNICDDINEQVTSRFRPLRSEELDSDLKGILNNGNVSKYMFLIKEALECDRKNEGYLDKLFNIINGYFNLVDVFNFFRGLIFDKRYDHLDLSSIPYELISQFKFFDCEINTLILPDVEEVKSLEGINFSSKKTESYSKIPHLIVNNITPQSYDLLDGTRLGRSCFTFLTNLYLELGRRCNARCEFCRNKALKPCRFDFDKIMTNFNEIIPYLDYVVVGGGEPTLYLKQLMTLLSLFGDKTNFFVSTNGTVSLDFFDEITKYAHINLSRHAVEDDDNDRIFKTKTLSTREINLLTFYSGEKKVNLVATCFKTGLDSPNKLFDYIKFSDDVRSDGVIFQNLHEDLNVGGPEQIDEGIFDEVIAKLKEHGYVVGSIPIYSTGDYKLILVKDPNTYRTIAFKKYITESELKQEWLRSAKRTFDLSMTPNGDVYQNWHQKSEKILLRK